MLMPTVAVVMPAYNEECLGDFLIEIEHHLAPVTSRLIFMVVDDSSVRPLDVTGFGGRLPLGSRIEVLRNASNVGHGPSAVRAWRAGLALTMDFVIHVDGDGQFLGDDFPRLLHEIAGRDGVVGVRQGRADPWFRRVLSLGARFVVGSSDCPDVNSPLRIYRTPTLLRLLDHVADDASVPHLQFSVLHRRLGLNVAQLRVTHQPRRGTSAVGTTWQREVNHPRVPSGRLIRLAGRAVLEVASCRLARAGRGSLGEIVTSGA
jgi:glycosyltransferase involved in cell wall biosynthesis